MKVFSFILTIVSGLALSLVSAGPVALPASDTNDVNVKRACKGNPVVLLHGLGANYREDINKLNSFLQSQGFCTYTLTYGAFPENPNVGGMQTIDYSSKQIAAFIRQVIQQSGARKVDLVGHSEGAFLALYVPKFGGVSQYIDKIVPIAPPTHGTTFAGLYSLTYISPGNPPLLQVFVNGFTRAVGCYACSEIVTGGAAVQRLNDGRPIVQPGNSVTVLISRYDELVTPTTTAFVREAGAKNVYIQDYCPRDFVGHIGEAYDPNVMQMVLSILTSKPFTFTCTF